MIDLPTVIASLSSATVAVGALFVSARDKRRSTRLADESTAFTRLEAENERAAKRTVVLEERIAVLESSEDAMREQVAEYRAVAEEWKRIAKSLGYRESVS